MFQVFSNYQTIIGLILCLASSYYIGADAVKGQYCIKSTEGQVDYYLSQQYSSSSLGVELATSCSCSRGLWIVDPALSSQQCIQAQGNLKYLFQTTTSGTNQYRLHSDSNACLGGMTNAIDFSELSSGCLKNDYFRRYLSLGTYNQEYLMRSSSSCFGNKWSFVSAAANGCGGSSGSTPAPAGPPSPPTGPTPTSGIYCLKNSYGGTSYINLEQSGSKYYGRTADFCNCDTAWKLEDKGGGKFTMKNCGTQRWANTVYFSSSVYNLEGSTFGSTYSGAWSWTGGCIGFAGTRPNPAAGTAIVKISSTSKTYNLGSCGSNSVTPVAPSSTCSCGEVTPSPATPAPLTPIPVPPTPIPTTPVPETPVPETPVPETPVPETPVPETPAPATPIPPTPIPETPVPETPVPETPVPETPLPETPVPETPVPETPVPETPVPETLVPETPIPGTPVPETPAPETPVPETPIPQTPVPETPVPETAVPETPLPETPVPETPVAVTPMPAAQSTPVPNTTPIPQTATPAETPVPEGSESETSSGTPVNTPSRESETSSAGSDSGTQTQTSVPSGTTVPVTTSPPSTLTPNTPVPVTGTPVPQGTPLPPSVAPTTTAEETPNPSSPSPEPTTAPPTPAPSRSQSLSPSGSPSVSVSRKGRKKWFQLEYLCNRTLQSVINDLASELQADPKDFQIVKRDRTSRECVNGSKIGTFSVKDDELEAEVMSMPNSTWSALGVQGVLAAAAPEDTVEEDRCWLFDGYWGFMCWWVWILLIILQLLICCIIAAIRYRRRKQRGFFDPGKHGRRFDAVWEMEKEERTELLDMPQNVDIVGTAQTEPSSNMTNVLAEALLPSSKSNLQEGDDSSAEAAALKQHNTTSSSSDNSATIQGETVVTPEMLEVLGGGGSTDHHHHAVAVEAPTREMVDML